jgi:poly(hydroxyalkanoate) depolymerase family esterase
MKNSPGAAIKEAMRLAHAQNPAEATRRLLKSLLGERYDTPPTAEERVSPAHHAEPEAHFASHIDESMERLKMPLGESLARLRSNGFPGVDLSPRALSQLGKRPKMRVPEGASYLSRTFTCQAGARPYKVYVPSKLRAAKAPLIVMLHGCTQNPDDFAVGTGMNQLAEEHGFVVAYPEQPITANQLGCWNWFNDKHQLRDLGEPSIIAGLTRSLISEMKIDRDRVFIAGLSAGGAMADVMSVTYPDLYAAAGVHSGLAYGVASDQASAFLAMSGKSRELGPRAARNRTRTVIFHGASDAKVHPTNAERFLIEARAGMAGSYRETTESGTSNGLAYRRTAILDARGVQVEYWAIDGLGHAWCGGCPEGSHTDRRGPDASREMLRFFLRS